MPLQSAYESILSNVGVEPVSSSRRTYESVVSNVGVEPVPSVSDGYESILEGDVNTAFPSPTLWAVIPGHGAQGDEIRIVGQGFGVAQATHDGLALLDLGLTDTAMPVISWGVVAGTANALTGDRQIDPVGDVFDPEHNEVIVSVPFGVTPGDYTVRVDTVGP